MGLLGVALATGMGTTLTPAAAVAAPSGAPVAHPDATDAHHDELKNPYEEKRRALRESAVADVLSGRLKPKTVNGSVVAKVGSTDAPANGIARGKAKVDQYVELQREKTDKIFVILAEFGNERHPDFPDRDEVPAVPGPATFEGPLVNKIPQPDRSKDNTTIWQKDYSPEHYRQLYFGKGKDVESVRTYYESQSSGRYSVDGTVTDWVRVKYNEARYGRSSDDPNDANGDNEKVCNDHICPTTWELIKDAANQWVADQKAKGRTTEEIRKDLADFDTWDRYDYDHDGNFNESDGYLDHFQIVHAGGDEADADPQQGEDAIWSHRWYAFNDQGGVTGPDFNLRGGSQIGDTGLWVGDYTMQPENGGLSVFAHEYGHDLGLPDDYDTTGRGDNSSEHWTLMAQSRLNEENGVVGTKPGDLGSWQKLQLGWLDYEIVKAGQSRTLELGPQEYQSDKPQAAIVVLPKKAVTREYGAPAAGAKQYWSGNADNLDTKLTRAFDLTGKRSATLNAKVRFAIEECCDYAYVEASTDGKNWAPLDGTVGGKPFTKDSLGRPRFTGTSATWADLAVPLAGYAGQKVEVRLHTVSDGGLNLGGLFVDEISVAADGQVVHTDGAEGGDSTWTLGGFKIVGSNITEYYDNFYIAGNRTYLKYDKYLKWGPYFYGYPDRPDFVDHYSYQTGLLIGYMDTSQADNNVSDHPGEVRFGYIDAHPEPMLNLTGAPWRARVQLYDAPFGLRATQSFTVHVNGQPSLLRRKPAQPLFDDTQQYWFAELPNHGIKLPKAGVKIKVLEETGSSVKVQFS
ncbi:immune inhibitor A domain-containing protein [Pilimelia anulata]|uniref:immune inhibitor A domain-containing protein n=1 Tax=Pilimelia anulata TaxID=53371 RepID=UPI0016655FA0|nr:immune inhibitor A domain-containing protein [Pilimelia anulata]